MAVPQTSLRYAMGIKMEEELLAQSGIQMVMHAGDARVFIRKSLDLAKENEFAKARETLEQANNELLEGHKIQTVVLQKECGGEPQGYCVLFAHGMDTLMTVKSEYELSEKIIEMFEIINQRLKKVEG